MRKYILIIAITIFLIIIGISYYKTNIMPVNIVEKYLYSRYNNTSYLNLADKIDIQKQYIDDSLLNTQYKFVSFDMDRKTFSENKYIVELINMNNKLFEKKSDYVKIYSTIEILIHKEEFPDWEQKTSYILLFTLKNSGLLKYKINYIKELDSHITVMGESISPQMHEHDHSHD